MVLDVTEKDFGGNRQGETAQVCGASNVVASPESDAFTGRISMYMYNA